MLFAPKEKGQGLVEYAIILALVAIVVIAVMRLLGPKIGNTFSTINSSLPYSALIASISRTLSLHRVLLFYHVNIMFLGLYYMIIARKDLPE